MSSDPTHPDSDPATVTQDAATRRMARDAAGSGPRVNFVHIATGLVVMAVGVLLLLVTNGVLNARQVVQLWPAAFVVIGAAVALQAMRGGEAARHIPVGGLIWLLLIGGLFSYTYDRRAPSVRSPNGTDIFSVMNDQHPTIEGDFHGGRVTTVMGGANLDLRKARVAPGETIVLDVFNVMGGSQIRVPENWEVSIETTALMGAVRDRRGERDTRDNTKDKDKKNSADDATGSSCTWQAPPDSSSSAPGPAPRVVIRGLVLMGGVDIRS